MNTIDFSLEKDGFIGKLYIPDEDHFTGKVLIAFSGSDGIFAFSQKLAEKFLTAGLTTMAVAYWNMPGLPVNLIPCGPPLWPERESSGGLTTAIFTTQKSFLDMSTAATIWSRWL